MKKFLSFIKFTIKFTLIFALIVLWLKFFIKNTLLSLIISIFSTLFLEILLRHIFSKQKNKLSLKSQEEYDAENMFFSLINDKNHLDFFYNLACTRHKNVIKSKWYVKILHENEKTTILFPQLTFKSFDEDMLVSILKKMRKTHFNKLVILCGQYEKSILKFVKNFDINIVVLDKFQAYCLLYKEYEFFPQITCRYKSETKSKFSELFEHSFNRSHSKLYIFSSLALFVMSFFVRMNIYYYIVVSLLLIFSIISFANTKYNYKKQEELL